MFHDEVFEITLLLECEPLVASLGDTWEASVLAFTHRRMLHAVVYVAIELGAFRALEDELDHFKAISLIDCPVITLHAKVFED